MRKKILVALMGTIFVMTSTSQCFAFDSMQRGSKSDAVKEVQQLLVDEGYLDADADGSFGAKTEQAVRNYQTDKGLDVTGVVDEITYNSLSDGAGEDASNKQSGKDESPSIAQSKYEELFTITKDQCEKDSLGLYSYKGFTFLSDEAEWLDTSWNKNGSINVSAFYFKLATCIEGFELGNNWKDYSPYILGYKPESREEFAAHIDDLKSFIVSSDAHIAVVNKLADLKSVTVDRQGDEYKCEIHSIADCVSELGISEEMLGYILGMFSDYGSEIDFNGQKCIITSIGYEKDDTEAEADSQSSKSDEKSFNCTIEEFIQKFNTITFEKQSETMYAIIEEVHI